MIPHASKASSNTYIPIRSQASISAEDGGIVSGPDGIKANGFQNGQLAVLGIIKETAPSIPLS